MQAIDFFGAIKPAAVTLHLLGVILGMGGALISDILFSFFSRNKKLNPSEIVTLTILRKIILYGLWVIILSGIALFLSDPEKYLSSVKFLAKMSIVLVLVVNGWVLNKFVWPHLLGKGFFTLQRERGTRRIAFASGAVSVISWLAAFILGTLRSVPWDYATTMGIYFAVLLFGILLAEIVERKEMN